MIFECKISYYGYVAVRSSRAGWLKMPYILFNLLELKRR